MVSQKLKEEFELGWDGEGIPFPDLTEKQWQILEAALLVFTEKGFSAATTSEIAQRAGVAEGTVFRHFKTKKDILLAVLTPLIRNLVGPHVVRSLKKVVDENREKPIRELLVAVMEDRYRIVDKNRKLLQFVLTESQYHPELREAFIRDVVSKVKDFAVAMVRERQARGELRQDLDPWVFVRSLVGTVAMYILAGSLFPWQSGEQDLKKDLEEMADLLLNGALADKKSSRQEKREGKP